MKDRLKKSSQNLPLYLFTGIFVAVLLLIIYAINGIFPFGEGNVAYDDLGQISVPIFTSIWDFLHGNGTALIEWSTGMGIFFGGTLQELTSPISVIFLLLCPRGMILEGLSFFVLAQFVLMAFSMLFFINKCFKIDPLWKIILSVLYPLSGYVLQLFSNVAWLDIAIVFPLLMVALKYLFEKGKILPYVLILAFCAVRSLYITYMVYFFLILVGGVYIIMIIPKNIRKTSVYNFGLGSAFGLLISAVLSIPSYFYLTSTSRYESTNSFFEIMSSSIYPSKTKIGMLIIMGALPLAIFLSMLLKFKKEKKKIGFFFIAVAILALPIIFENINLFWHMGSYVFFPMRFGFMLSFILLTACAFAVQRFGAEFFKSKGVINYVFLALCLAFTGVGAYLIIVKKVLLHPALTIYKYSSFLDDFLGAMILFILLFACYFMLLKVGKKRIATVFICILLVLEAGVYTNRAFAETIVRTREYDLSFIGDCQKIYESRELQSDNLSRIKNTDSSLNTNYSLIIGQSAFSNFTHIIPPEISTTMKSLGYSTIYTRILDVGGTLLTDALLNNKNAISKNSLDSQAYTLTDKIAGYNIYDDNYTLPFGILTNSDIVGNTLLDGNAFEVNNKIYKSISGDKDNIISIVGEPNDIEDNYISYEINIEGSKRLYFSNPTAASNSECIILNGQTVKIPTLGNLENERYKASFNNNIVDLGTFTDEKVTVTVKGYSEKDKYTDAMIGIMDMQKLSILCDKYKDYNSNAVAQGKSLTMTVNAEKNGEYAFIPVAYYDGWSCSVNGVTTNVERSLGCFMSVKLSEGENVISMKYCPKGLKAGFVISALSIIGLAVLLLKRKRRPLEPEYSNFVLTALEKIYIVAIFAFIAVIYLISILCSFLL